MTEKTKKRNQEKTLFETEQQVRKDKVIAAAATYLSGRKQGRRRCRQKIS